MKKLIFLIIFTLLMSTGCQSISKEPLSQTEFLLGTVCRIELYDNKSTEILDIAFQRIADMENMLSVSIPDSEISNINSNAGSERVSVSEDTFELIEKGVKFSQMSEGLFDITIGPLTSLWRIGLPEAQVPSRDEIEDILGLINYKDVVLDRRENTVYLKNADMRMDLGGIAKGYIADEVANILREAGVTSAIIDLGGNVFALGELNGGDWTLGIRAPDGGGVVGVINCTDNALVTSGIYERYTIKDGKKYHHILNPRNGYPVNNEIASVTVMCENSTEADALSTIAFVSGLKDGFELIDGMDGVEALFITTSKDIYFTSGLKDIFTLIDESYTVVTSYTRAVSGLVGKNSQ